LGGRGLGIDCVSMGKSGREGNQGEKATRCDTVSLFAVDQTCSGLLCLHQGSRSNLWETWRPSDGLVWKADSVTTVRLTCGVYATCIGS